MYKPYRLDRLRSLSPQVEMITWLAGSNKEGRVKSSSTNKYGGAENAATTIPPSASTPVGTKTVPNLLALSLGVNFERGHR